MPAPALVPIRFTARASMTGAIILRWDSNGNAAGDSIDGNNNWYRFATGPDRWLRVRHSVPDGAGGFDPQLRLEGDNPRLGESPNTTLFTIMMSNVANQRDPVELLFDSPVRGVGVVFLPGKKQDFTAELEVFDDAHNSLARVQRTSPDQGPVFLGAGFATPQIFHVELDLVKRVPQGFRFSQLSILL